MTRTFSGVSRHPHPPSQEPPAPGAGDTSRLEATAGDIWYQEVHLEGATRRCCFQAWWRVPSPRSHLHGTAPRSFRENHIYWGGGRSRAHAEPCAGLLWSGPTSAPFSSSLGTRVRTTLCSSAWKGHCRLARRRPRRLPARQVATASASSPPSSAAATRALPSRASPASRNLFTVRHGPGDTKTTKTGFRGSFGTWDGGFEATGWWLGLSTHLHTTAPSPSAPAMAQPSPGGVSPLLGRLQENMACPSPRTPQDPKTLQGYHSPAPVPGGSPRRVSPGGQPVSQQWHSALQDGSSALCQLGGEDRAGGEGSGGPQPPPQDPHGAMPAGPSSLAGLSHPRDVPQGTPSMPPIHLLLEGTGTCGLVTLLLQEKWCPDHGGVAWSPCPVTGPTAPMGAAVGVPTSRLSSPGRGLAVEAGPVTVSPARAPRCQQTVHVDLPRHQPRAGCVTSTSFLGTPLCSHPPPYIASPPWGAGRPGGDGVSGAPGHPQQVTHPSKEDISTTSPPPSPAPPPARGLRW